MSLARLAMSLPSTPSSGLPIWRFHRKQDIKNPYQINPSNRGVAILDGRVFFGTLDDNLDRAGRPYRPRIVGKATGRHHGSDSPSPGHRWR